MNRKAKKDKMRKEAKRKRKKGWKEKNNLKKCLNKEIIRKKSILVRIIKIFLILLRNSLRFCKILEPINNNMKIISSLVITLPWLNIVTLLVAPGLDLALDLNLLKMDTHLWISDKVCAVIVTFCLLWVLSERKISIKY